MALFCDVEPFRFKYFSLQHHRSAMRLTTDSVLLGAWVRTGATAQAVVHITTPQTVLDVGTGCGILALMMAQRFQQARIYAIDIDELSVREARENVSLSPWPERICIFEGDFRSFVLPHTYDLIITNPPYFRGALLSSYARRTRARHSDDSSITHEELLKGAVHKLTEDGVFALILPADREVGFLSMALKGSVPLYPSRITRVTAGSALSCNNSTLWSTTGEEPTRVLLELTKKQTTPRIETLPMYDKGRGKYSPQYMALIKDFYLWA